MNIIKSRLDTLRKLMKERQLDMYLVPGTDAHFNEYLPTCWQRRAWISGFTGSAGEVLVTQDHAYLWTDGRYYLQANSQLDTQEYTLMKQNSFMPETESWIAKNVHNQTLGVDPHLISNTRAQVLNAMFKKGGGKLELIEENLIDQCRLEFNETLTLPCGETFILNEKYSGESAMAKLAWLQQQLIKQEADYIVLSALDEIAWLFNLRGADIDFNPLVISYAIISINKAYLFVDHNKINLQVRKYLEQNNVQFDRYENFGYILEQLNGTIWLDEKATSYWVFNKIKANSQLITATSPIVHKKASKNKAEVDGARYAHVKDGVAVISFLAWLSQNWQQGLDELSCADKLLQFRQLQQNFIGPSFDTISGFAANSAVIHYRATVETNKAVDDSNIFLLDSGGQYLDGTTDITRTIHLGNPSLLQKHHYTLVLKGHLALGRAVFVPNTCGEHLDVLARSPLWGEYLDYRHGTGHGVGSCLCVHEGPQRISTANSGVKLVPGMIVSNEPGVYISGQYGIRIENLCLVTEDQNPLAQASEYGEFHKFETLTLVPYCSALIDKSILSPVEIKQIQEYYKLIKLNVSHLLDAAARNWLDNELDSFLVL
ncbi:MAG: aminopeptidase P family protein [Burkholderiales bacterium]|nr:aminopeptidase P family protein [Burkholderiales bacterium]